MVRCGAPLPPGPPNFNVEATYNLFTRGTNRAQKGNTGEGGQGKDTSLANIEIRGCGGAVAAVVFAAPPTDQGAPRNKKLNLKHAPTNGNFNT